MLGRHMSTVTPPATSGWGHGTVSGGCRVSNQVKLDHVGLAIPSRCVLPGGRIPACVPHSQWLLVITAEPEGGHISYQDTTRVL